MVVVMVYYIYYERSYFSLSFDVYVILKGRKLRKLWIYNDLFHFYFLNTDISVTLYVIVLRFSVCVLKDLPEGSVSQIFDLSILKLFRHSFAGSQCRRWTLTIRPLLLTIGSPCLLLLVSDAPCWLLAPSCRLLFYFYYYYKDFFR